MKKIKPVTAWAVVFKNTIQIETITLDELDSSVEFEEFCRDQGLDSSNEIFDIVEVEIKLKETEGYILVPEEPTEKMLGNDRSS